MSGRSITSLRPWQIVHSGHLADPERLSRLDLSAIEGWSTRPQLSSLKRSEEAGRRRRRRRNQSAEGCV